MIRIVVTLICLCALASSASAQSQSAPVFGGVGVPAPSPRQGPSFSASSGSDMLRHRSPTGSPCLDVSGSARRHNIDANLYDHVITVMNNCAQRITIQVCYYNTEDCVPMEIPGGERKEAILGTMPATPDFRFEFREKF